MANISYRAVREEWEQAYVPIIKPRGGTFYVRFRGSADAAFRSIRSILRQADPTLPINVARTLDEQVRRSLSTERMLGTLTASFGALALLLALVGLYGVIAFAVTQRTREIGIGWRWERPVQPRFGWCCATRCSWSVRAFPLRCRASGRSAASSSRS